MTIATTVKKTVLMEVIVARILLQTVGIIIVGFVIAWNLPQLPLQPPPLLPLQAQILRTIGQQRSARSKRRNAIR